MIFAKVVIVMMFVLSIFSAGIAASKHGQPKTRECYTGLDTFGKLLEAGVAVGLAYSIGWF